MNEKRWQDDPEFEEHLIEDVRVHSLTGRTGGPLGGNFSVKYNGVWVFRFDSPDLVPQVGQRIRLFGKFNSVRGIVIDDQVVYYYPTQDEAHQAAREKRHP